MGLSDASGPRRLNSKDLPFKDFDLAVQPGPLLRLCHQRSHEIFKAELDHFGLTRQQTAFLISLLKQPSASIQELADLTGVDRNTLSAMLSRLVKKGLVERKRSKADARAYEMKVTQTGIALLEKMEEGVRKVQRQILEPLTPAEREAFLKAAQKLAGLEGKARDNG